MKKIKVLIATTMVVSILAMSSPVSAQSNPDSRTTTTERYDDDNDKNYSWIGLLGLLGLAGLVKKNNKDVRDLRDSTSKKYNT